MKSRGLSALLILAFLLSLLPAQMAGAASPLDYDIPNGHFYQQANGRGGEGNTGFAVTDNDNVLFWTWFNRLGGVNAVGYPVTHRFQWKGFTVQAFQKVVFQWRPESGQVMFVNLFDEMSAAGKDDWLYNVRMTPRSLDWSSDSGKPWGHVLANHLAILDQYPAIKQSYYGQVGDPVTMNGLPMGVQEFPNAVVVRAQRKVFQQWKTAQPWAAAGQVTVSNGGDLGKEAGLYPQDAITPRPWNQPAPCPAPVINGFSVSPSTITQGQSATLSWGFVNNANDVSIDQGVGGIGTPGSRAVSPSGTTTYTLRAVGPCGTTTATATLFVNGAPVPTPVPAPAPVPQVQQVSPVGGARVQGPPHTVTLRWNSADAPGSVHYTYNVKVEKGLGNFWVEIANVRGIDGTSFDIQQVPSDTDRLRWQVSASSPTGHEGPQSPWAEFTVEMLPQ